MKNKTLKINSIVMQLESPTVKFSSILKEKNARFKNMRKKWY